MEENWIEGMLEIWGGENVPETEKLSLKEFIQFAQWNYKVKDWRESFQVVKAVIDYAKEITGSDNALENAKILHKAATYLNKTDLEMAGEVNVFRLSVTAVEFYEMAGEKKKAEKLRREVSNIMLKLNRQIWWENNFT